MKTYSQAPDVTSTIETVQRQYHEDLEHVTVAGLFAFDTEHTDPVLTHGGYPAGAIVRITPLKDRALGMADASIVVDRAGWLALSQRQRVALIDHELTHLERKVDAESHDPVCDALDRPKLVMCKHDHQFGWFDDVAQRHGEASPEVRQARVLMESSGQLYFDFGARVPAPHSAPLRGPGDDDDGDDEDVEQAALPTPGPPKRAVKRPPARAVRNPKPRHLNA